MLHFEMYSATVQGPALPSDRHVYAYDRTSLGQSAGTGRGYDKPPELLTRPGTCSRWRPRAAAAARVSAE